MTKTNRVYNFSAGPSMLPLEVLENVKKNLLSYEGCGQSVMEMSHRSAEFKKIIEDCETNLRDLMNIPDNYKVLFIQGGGTLQFAMIPMNLLSGSGKADYIVSGTWSKKAYKEALKFGDIKLVATSEKTNFAYVPKVKKEDIRPDADYVYICYNETIQGIKYHELPETDAPIVADMSSCFLSEEVNVEDYGVIWAGVQKNLAPAGMAIVIIRDDLIGKAPATTPTYLDYKTHADNGSTYNTPPCWTIYVAGEVIKHLKAMGGIKEMERRNKEKAAILYDYLDSDHFYKTPPERPDRSLMNVVFITGDAALDKKFVEEAKEYGLINLNGHRSIGGMRASIYNAMPKEGVEKLVEFMKKFEAENK